MFARSAGSSALRRCSQHQMQRQSAGALSLTSKSAFTTTAHSETNHVVEIVNNRESDSNKPNAKNTSIGSNKATMDISSQSFTPLQKRRHSSVAATIVDSSSFDTPTDRPSSPRSEKNKNGTRLQSNQTKENKEEDKQISTAALKELYKLASKPCTPLSLSNMFKYASAITSSKNYSAQRLRNAQFLHQELQIRIAQRTVDLLNLPHGLNHTKPVLEIAHIYLRYLRKFQNFPIPQTHEEELAFTDMLRPIVLDQNLIPNAIARGVAYLKDNRKEHNHDVTNDGDLSPRLEEMEKALYRFFTARTGLRLLTEHHILSCMERQEAAAELKKKHNCFSSLSSSSSPESEVESSSLSLEEEDETFFGCIKGNCDPASEARKVAQHVMQECHDTYGLSPDIEILDCTPVHFSNKSFTYVPHHLQYMLAELLKNSCRATVNRYMNGDITTEDHSSLHNLYEGDDKSKTGVLEDNSLPPIRVVIVKGEEDVTIKIADKGGGVARSVVDKMWTFAHSFDDRSSQNRKAESGSSNSSSNTNEHHFDGFSDKNIRGFGLPLARIYARYFGGELTLKSMEGYGVDAYLYLPVLGVACENLPIRVRKSPGNYDSNYSGDIDLDDLHQSDGFNISGVEPWGGGRQTREYSTSSKLARLTRFAL